VGKGGEGRGRRRGGGVYRDGLGLTKGKGGGNASTHQYEPKLKLYTIQACTATHRRRQHRDAGLSSCRHQIKFINTVRNIIHMTNTTGQWKGE